MKKMKSMLQTSFRFHRLLALILAYHIISSDAASDLTFLSGVASTTHSFSMHQQHINHGEETRIVKRHHLICLHIGPFAQSNASSKKCCNDLWQKGLIETKHRQSCFDHMVLLPDVQSPAAAMGSMIDAHSTKGDVRPMYYLAIEEEHKNNVALASKYLQVRHVMARDHKERQNIRDSLDNRVVSYSPFHLVGFMPEGSDVRHNHQINNNDNRVSLMNGKVNGTLSLDGGMHRAFRQRVTLSSDGINFTQKSSSLEHYQMNINATVFLPLMESVFIDADDPFLVEYDAGSTEPTLCRISLPNNQTTSVSRCDIKFLSSETIDIEQPSFASRQYVVAFQINATIEFTTSDIQDTFYSLKSIGIDYGTTLHIRYISPISNENDELNGVVPIAIQQPTLYSSSLRLSNIENGNVLQYVVLDTDPAPHVSEELEIPDPIIVHVAVGMDDDYWWVTTVTMIAALVGGLVVMRSIDSVSIWV